MDTAPAGSWWIEPAVQRDYAAFRAAVEKRLPFMASASVASAMSVNRTYDGFRPGAKFNAFSPWGDSHVNY